MRRFLMFLVGASAATFLMLGNAAAAVAQPVLPGTTVLTFGELPFQPVDGLSFEGVTFRFTIADVHSTDANYDGLNGGIERYVQDPSLEGNALGALTLTFAQPAHILQFGVARSLSFSLKPGCLVKLFDASGRRIGSYSVNTEVYVAFAEGLFRYSGPTPVARAVLSFPLASDASRFAIDNLTFRG